ncbi:MAG TPA: T9SS type A sorting domain-containing protein [Bacteroidia bacterium]|jgi:hypothetical protein|nr:T9SS type A sorting domain-containing protein [Bacteroidia bacterium]HQK96750.1 T9SS type A sorting domain-containing protein [Bacteroidia bacterium]
MIKKLYYLFLILIFPNTTYSQITTFPYSEHFDSGAGGWTSQTINGTSWELGVPTAWGILGAYSAPNCWGTDLDSGYRVNSFTYLTSPKFYIGSMTNPYFSFFQIQKVNNHIDGFFLEYSTDDVTWQLLGDYNCSYATNWYDNATIYAVGHPAFSGSTNAWTQSGIYLNGLGINDSLRIRFVFKSNNVFGSALAGIFIDNVALYQHPVFLKDIEPLGFINPSGNLYPGNIYPIDLLVKNISKVPIDTITCGIKIGTTISSAQVIQHIDSGAIDTIHLGTRIFQQGQNNLCAFATPNGDVFHGNDTICNLFVTTSNSNNYIQNFETNDGTWYNSSTSSTSWQYGTPSYGQTSTAHSGTKCWDINLNLYYNESASAFLYTPIFDFTTTPLSKLSFWINYYTEPNYDGTRLEYSTDGGLNWQTLGYPGDPNSTNWYTTFNLDSTGLPAWTGNSYGWLQVQYDLSFLQPFNNVQFRFSFTSNYANNYDGVSIDDFIIRPISFKDVNLSSITNNNLNYPLGNTTDSLTFKLVNLGTLPITNFNYGYTVNNAPGVSAIFNGSLIPGDSIEIKLPGFNLINSPSSICGYIQLVDDVDTTNNSTCVLFYGTQLYTLPYFKNFDGGSPDWRPDNTLSIGSSWVLGYPNYGYTSGTHSGNNAWDINLITGYLENANSYLYTPIFDISNSIHPKLSFWQKRKVESNWDGMRIEYSVESQNWNLLGHKEFPNSVNWYNDSLINSSQLPAWTGMSSGWEYSSISLDTLQPAQFIQFRFVFTSDPNVNEDGITIDDFAITAAYENDVELLSFSSPGSILNEGTITPIQLNVKNKGTNPITQLNLSYIINNGAVQTFNWTGNLLTDSIVNLNIGFITPIAGNNNIVVYNTWLADMDHINDTLQINTYAIYLQDAGVSLIASPVSNTISGSTQTVSVSIVNDGVYTLTNVPISMKLNNDLPITSTWTGSLLPGANANFLMPNLIAAIDTNRLKVYIDWPSDMHHENDTAYSIFYGYPTNTLNYSTDFELPNGGWRTETSNQLTQWQYGTPNFGSTNTTHSGSKCWDINLNTPYSSAVVASLLSPYFIVNPGTTIKLDFWTNYSTESNADGLYIEYSQDEINWTHLGIVNDPQGNNWYNSTLTLNKPGWSGISQGWKNCSYTFTPNINTNYIIFRYRFISNVNLVDAGVSIDDVNLSVVTGIEEEIGKSGINIYPNPAYNKLIIKGNISHPFEIKNILGETVITINKVDFENIIDISQLSSGMYIIKGEDFTEKSLFIKY